MSVLTSRSYVKHNTLCTGLHSALLRARPALRLQTLTRQSAGVRTGANAFKAQVSCQHGRQPVRRSAATHIQVRAEEDMLEPVPAWRKVVSFLLKSSAAVALVLALTFGSISSAEAARSGGRMGGSGFSAARSGSSSYSGGSSSRSYGGSLGGSSSRSYGGSTVGSTSTTPLSNTATPAVSSNGGDSSSTGYGSFFGPGLAGGYGYGYGGGFGGPVVVQRSDGGSGLITILVVIAAIFVISQVAGNFAGNDNGSGGGQATVCTVQVGLLGSARGLQRDLERIAGRADTNTPDGLHYVLQETVLSLLRNPDYCVYGDGGTKNPRGLDGAEDAFNEVVLQERGKFKEETLVNVGGRSRRSSLKSRGDGMSELIVVTIIVAAEGGVKVPKISSREELTKALNKLGALRSEQILAVEVMWTPQDENDTYTRDELFLDYPTLNTL
ncbi:hypothetical protein ABBQ38_000885 [Trebouxia sp. C0009 RCD-2024]